MHRYKFTKENIAAAVKYVSGTAKTGPVYSKKHRDELTVKNKKLFYKGMLVVPGEDVERVLRNEVYKKGGDVPSGRDAAFHILKKRYVGITRRLLMEFLRKQRTLGETRPSVPQAKQTAGEKLKTRTYETDLIFLRRNDLENANPKFKRQDLKKETYFVSTVEKYTGLFRCAYVSTKDASVVTPIVIKQLEELSKQLGSDLKLAEVRSDRGGEFNHAEIKKYVKSTKFVRMGPHVENKNRTFQNHFFRILRQRKATTIRDAMKQAEALLNNTLNRIQKGTPNEIAERGDEEADRKQYNKTRPVYKEGRKRELAVGDHVRLLKKGSKADLKYKSYKNLAWSEQVYVIKRKTKKAIPPKYYVSGKWYVAESLLKSGPRDKISDMLVKGRDADEAIADREDRKETFQKQMKENFNKKGKRAAHLEGREKKLLADRKLDKVLDAEEDEDADREIIETKTKVTLSAEQKQEQKEKLHEIYKKTTYKKYLTEHKLPT